MTKNNFVKVATIIFTIVGAVHLYRAVSDLPLVMGGWMIPVSLSWFAGLLALLMAYSGYRYWSK